MSQPSTYEQLIAQKLQELEVPDQANSIWATIEQHLNIEMPVNGPGSGGGSTNPWWLGGGGGSLLTLFVATVTYIIISKQKLERDRNLNDAPASIQYKQPSKTNQDTAKNAVPLREIMQNKPPASKSNEQIQEAVAPTSDSVSIAPVPKDVVTTPVQPVQKDTVPTTKKPRGVRGLSDADYRIVPDKADSSRRKN